MAPEPERKRAIAFIDGQNLFHAAKVAFGRTYPDYDVVKLVQSVCAAQGWDVHQVRFYTGVPDASDNERWHTFWSKKLAAMGRAGVYVYSRPLRYRNRLYELPDGTNKTILVGQEKGIDVRIALDVIRLAHRGEYDVAVVFSQDQDLSEAADEVRQVAIEQRRWIKIASAFPDSPTMSNHRGVNHTDWLKIDRELYESCIDQVDHRTPSA